MSRRLASSAIAAACLVLAAGVVAWAARGSAPPTDVSALARLVDARVEHGAAGLHARLGTLAELPRLAAAVSTDATTVRGLTQEELAFRPRPGETIAIGQLPRLAGAAAAGGGQTATADGPRRWGTPVILLLAPGGADVPALIPAGPGLRIVRDRLTISEALAVTPLERAEELDGVVAASWPVDLGDFTAALAAARASATIVVGGRQLAVGDPPPATNVRSLRAPLESRFSAGAYVLFQTPPAPRPVGPWVVAAILAAIGVVVLAVGRRSSTASPASIAATALPAAPVGEPTPARTPALWSPESGDPAPAVPRTAMLSPRSVAGESPVRKIGRYEIVRLLGSGGMAEVYLARLTGEAGFTKLIALKILQPALARQTMVVELFLDEAHLASQLDHPNIVEIIDLGRADDEYYIAMEFVDGADLAGLIEMSHRQQRPIPVPVAIAILRKICDGLHAAHTGRAADGNPLALVHRDVKSANVFVAKNGVVKVGDFGIAKASDRSRVSRTEIGLVKGTPGYMAPEHRLGQPLDGRADLYGVGAIAYELLAGVPVNLDLMVLVQKGTAGWPHLAPLSNFRADVPAALEQLVWKALAYERDDRFSDCATLEAALEVVAQGYPAVNSEKAVAQWIEVTLRAGAPTAAAQSPSSSSSSSPSRGLGGGGVG